MSDAIRVLSAGAAESLIGLMGSRFTTETGFRVDASFAGVGVVMTRLEAGEYSDVVILTEPIIAELERRGIVAGASVATIGTVSTSLAVKDGSSTKVVQSHEDLSDALKEAGEIHVPNFVTTTAGRHIRRMLEVHNLIDELRPRLRIAPNGAAAMRSLAETQEKQALGFAQTSEILSTKGTTFVANLPPPFNLSTRYAMAVMAGSKSTQAAARLVALSTDPSSRIFRTNCGFE